MKEVFCTEDNEHRQLWQWWDSNYSNRGNEWEREAKVAIFDENKELLLSEECGIRIQGGGSRGKLPKSVGCYARETYGGSRKFTCDLFESGIKLHKFVFFSGGDDNIFKLRDYVVNMMCQELAFSTMDFIPCAVFLDGEYWGLYYITENYNSDYISDHFLVKKDNVIMMKNWEMAEGREEDSELFKEMREFITGNDMKIEKNYEKACELIDMESYIDYYATQIYIARWNDWPSSNWAAWRTRENDGSTYGDCKWRWMMFDVNPRSISSDQEEVDTLSVILQSDEMFHSLYLNDTFRAKFAERILYIGNEIFSPDRCEEFLYEWETKMREPVSISNRRFYNDRKEEEFNAYVEEIRRFFYGRYEVVWNSLANNVVDG